MNDLRKAAEATLFRLLGDENHDIRLRAAIALLQALAQPEQYDQTALELCEKCGWKAIMPDEGCLVCTRKEDKQWVGLTKRDLSGYSPELKTLLEYIEIVLKRKNT